MRAVPGPRHGVGGDAMPWPALGEGHCCCPDAASVWQEGVWLCQTHQKTVATTSTVDKWCREDGLRGCGKGTWELGTFLVPSGETGTFLGQSPSAKQPRSTLPQAHFWDTDPIRSAQVRPTAPRLHGTTWDLLQAAGTKTHPSAPFLPRHLHDGDVEGVGDVGGSGQVPAAVETLWVVVGPAHQHWLLRRDCQGKRKSNYRLR